MSNVTSLPGSLGSRMSNGTQGTGSAPAPANPFAAFIQSILGGFIGGSVLTGPAETPAAPALFAGLPGIPAGQQKCAAPASGDKTGEKGPADQEKDQETPASVQVSLIGAFAPQTVPVLPLAPAETTVALQGDDSAPQENPAAGGVMPAGGLTVSASAPGSDGDLLSSLPGSAPAPGPAALPAIVQGDAETSPQATAGQSTGAVAGQQQDSPQSVAAPPSASGSAPAGIDFSSIIAGMPGAAEDAAPEIVTPLPPPAAREQDVPAAQQVDPRTRTLPSSVRPPEIPLPAVQAAMSAPDAPAAPRPAGVRDSGGTARRDTKSIGQTSAQPASDDGAPVLRDVSALLDPSPGRKPASEDSAQGQTQAAPPVTEKAGDASEGSPAAAPAAAKGTVDETPRASQSAPESAPVPPPASAARNAAQVVTPAGEVITRQEPSPVAAPRQEIPTAYAPLPQEVSRHIADQVVRNLSFQVDGTASDMRMTLRPPSLGEVQLHVHVEDSKMAAQIDVSQQLVKSALEAHMPQLRQALQEYGIEVQRIDVMVPEQSMQRDGAGSGGERTGRRTGRRAGSSGDDDAVQAVKDMGYNTIELIM